MIVKSGFDEKTVEQIARASGSKAVRGSIAYLRRAHYNNPQTFVCEVFDGQAFYAGSMARKHFRLYEMAVVEGAQGSGYGKLMVARMRALCQKYGAEKITLRTSREEDAINFYHKMGGVVTGIKDNDYEVEIRA